MKTSSAVLAVIALALLGCRLATQVPGSEPVMPTGPASPTLAEVIEPAEQAEGGALQGADSTAQGDAPGRPETDWRVVYGQGAVLFEVCTVAYQTQSDYAQGAIALERASAELEAEANVAEYVWRDITSTQLQDESAASHLFEIETQAMALVELLVPQADAIGSSEVLAALDEACRALQGQMDAIVADATSAGLTMASFNELEGEVAPMIEELYNQTLWGR